MTRTQPENEAGIRRQVGTDPVKVVYAESAAGDDVEVVVMGSDIAALKAGQVDAVTGWQTNVGALSATSTGRRPGPAYGHEDDRDFYLWAGAKSVADYVSETVAVSGFRTWGQRTLREFPARFPRRKSPA